jgi:serine/threonine-protein phosphatase PGAM5
LRDDRPHANVERIGLGNRLLYLARHGESDATHGASPEDGELTALGRRQSQLFGTRLQGIAFSAIHHSPWTRAIQTAQIVAEYLPGVPLHPSELSAGVHSGGARPATAHAKPGRVLRSDAQEWVAAGPGQAAAAIQAYAGLVTEDRRDLIIGHGNLINWFVTRALDGPDHAWLHMLDYSCALTVIMYLPDRTRLISYNDMGHLPPSMRGTEYPLEARV